MYWEDADESVIGLLLLQSFFGVDCKVFISTMALLILLRRDGFFLFFSETASS